jgi:hypothetical protein
MTDNVGKKHILELVEKNEWENVFVLTNEKMIDSVDFSCEVNMVIINSRQSTEDLIGDITGFLKGNLKGLEVAVNLFSGTGKEHMAIIASILKMGFGMRLVKHGESGVKEL